MVVGTLSTSEVLFFKPEVMIKCYWNVITGFEFWIIKEPINYKSRKQRRNLNK